MTRSVVAVAVAFLIVVGAPRVDARPATRAEVRDLAERAVSDPVALQQLRSIDSVDGTSVDLASALATNDAEELRSRLRSLGGEDATATIDAGRARSDAGSIVQQRRFRSSKAPRPFKGVLESAGRRLEGWWDAVAKRLPGQDATLWTIVGALVVSVAVFTALRLGRRRRRAVGADAPQLFDRPRDRPSDLEKRARQAESEGDLETAIRLRFLAGLLRLDAAGAIEWRSSITTGDVRRKVASPAFASVAGSFERVAYGRRAPTQADAELSRDGWTRVLEETSA
jgi:hypothetical protein